MRSGQSKKRSTGGITGGPGRSSIPVFSPPSKRELLWWVGRILSLDIGRLEEVNLAPDGLTEAAVSVCSWLQGQSFVKSWMPISLT